MDRAGTHTPPGHRYEPPPAPRLRARRFTISGIAQVVRLTPSQKEQLAVEHGDQLALPAGTSAHHRAAGTASALPHETELQVTHGVQNDESTAPVTAAEQAPAHDGLQHASSPDAKGERPGQRLLQSVQQVGKSIRRGVGLSGGAGRKSIRRVVGLSVGSGAQAPETAGLPARAVLPPQVCSRLVFKTTPFPCFCPSLAPRPVNLPGINQVRPALSSQEFVRVSTLELAPSVFFRDLAPRVFEVLRNDIFGVSNAEYTGSIWGDTAVNHLS